MTKAELTEQNTSLLTSVENLNKSVQELEKENAELEDKLANADYQLEGRDNEIRELEKKNKVLAQNLEDTEIVSKALEKENASLKDALEGYKQNAKWCDKCDKIAELKKENAELKKQQFSLRNERNTFLAQNEQYEKDLIDFNENLTKAIKVIKDIVEVMVIAPIQYSERQKIDVLAEAEQFLKNDGCPDVMCEDCTKEDCEIKKLGLVEVKK